MKKRFITRVKKMSILAPNKPSPQAASLSPSALPSDGFETVLAQGISNSNTLVKPIPAIDPVIIKALNRAYFTKSPQPHLTPLAIPVKPAAPVMPKLTGIFGIIIGAELFLTSFLDPKGAKLSGEVPWNFSQKDMLDINDLFNTIGWGNPTITTRLKALKPAQKNKLFEASLSLLKDSKLNAVNLKIAVNELLKIIETGKANITNPAPIFTPPRQPLDRLGERPKDTKNGFVPITPKKQQLKLVPDVIALPQMPTYKPVPFVPDLPHVTKPSKPAPKGSSLPSPVVPGVEFEPLVQDGKPSLAKKPKKHDATKKQTPRSSSSVSTSDKQFTNTNVKKGNTDNPSKAQKERKTKQDIDRASTKITKLFDTINWMTKRHEEITAKLSQLMEQTNNISSGKHEGVTNINFNRALDHSKTAKQFLSEVDALIKSAQNNFSIAQNGLTNIQQYTQNTDGILFEVKEKLSITVAELKQANAKVIGASLRIKWAMEILSKENARQDREFLRKHR
jgi:hypothetical protein